MQEKIKILAINPGSTSTKFSVLELNLQAKNNKDEIVSVFQKMLNIVWKKHKSLNV